MPLLLLPALLALSGCVAPSSDVDAAADSGGTPVDSGDSGSGDSGDTAALAANDAAFVGQSLPSSATAGAAVSGTITMRNTGSASWSLSDGYYLGSEGPQDNFVWGTNRTFMAADASVTPGEEYTFTLDVVAPSAAGEYPMQWRMLQDAVEWFGATSDVAAIQVDAAPEPWATVTEEQLRAWRGSIATTLAPTACGPRPYEDNNPVFTAQYDSPCWTADDRTIARDAEHAHGYTHWAMGPLVQNGYHGQYPDTNWLSDPNGFLDPVEELWNDGFYPAIFLLPDTGLCADGSSIDHDCVESTLTPIYTSERYQKLARIVVLAWEPSYSAADWQWGVAWMARVFPNALRYIHFPSGHGAPGRGEELEPTGPYANEAAMWEPVAPYIHGFLQQETNTFGGETDESRTPEEQFTYDLGDMVRRFRDGYAGWPTEGAGGKPVDVVAYEYASYFCNIDTSQGAPEDVAARALEWGALALEVDGVAGFGDGGP